MHTTMQLYHHAMTVKPSAAFWCEQLGVSRNTLAVAKIRGRLSPTVAGNLARLLGEPVQEWVAIAALEGEPESYGKQKVIQMIEMAEKAKSQIASLYLSLGRFFHRPRISAR